MHPRQMRDTTTPLLPSCVYCMRSLSLVQFDSSHACCVPVGSAAMRYTISVLIVIAALTQSMSAQPAPSARNFIRINQLGYLPDAPKTAVVCSLDETVIRTFTIQDASG